MPVTKLFKRRGIKGQLSIFAAIIFQTLFVLFAMSLNIALVVHDKINLQNSVDLAAYYGAMKQAEVLNAIAHINYQIRQSWKLMVWRNRVLGTLGSTSTRGLQPLPTATPTDQQFWPRTYKIARGPYVTCIGYHGWKLLLNNTFHSAGNDNFCNQIENQVSFVNVPSFTGVLGTLSSVLSAMTNRVINGNKTIQHKCKAYGYNSWFLAFFSVVYLQRDQSARKTLIYKLAELLSQGKDLDNREIVTGAQNTFFKNLTFINQTSFTQNSFQTSNSLQNISPNQWLEDYGLPVLPLYASIDSLDSGCKIAIHTLHEAPAHCVDWNNSQCQTASQLKDQILFSDPSSQLCSSGICKMSAGLQKKKDFIVFFSASAELQYQNQIFLPGGPITLKAKAYAKPFGGRIGPPRGVDRLLPTWPGGGNGTKINAEEFDVNHAPNYSRYPGDRLGLRSEYVHYLWANYLSDQTFTRNMKNYSFKQRGENDPDILAKDHDTGSTANFPARYWELAAIAPDLFDVSYFTILPNYMETYHKKIRTLFGRQIPGGVRSDLGYTNQQNIHINLEWQIKNAWNQLRSVDTKNRIPSGNPFYNIAKLDQVLTGWQAPKQKYRKNSAEYQANNMNRFPFSWCDPGNFSNDGWAKRSPKIAAGCFYGGRTGYSVKMISPCSLLQMQVANDLSYIDDSKCP